MICLKGNYIIECLSSLFYDFETLLFIKRIQKRLESQPGDSNKLGESPEQKQLSYFPTSCLYKILLPFTSLYMFITI